MSHAAPPVPAEITTEEPGALTVESRSFEYVPETERFGRLRDQPTLWFMMNASLVSVFAGTVGPVFGLGLGWTIVAIIAGNIVGTVFQALHAAQGPVMGIPQMIQSRVQFGSRGALIPLVAAVITLVGFPVFSLQTGAGALASVVPVDVTIGQILLGGVAIVVAIFGYKLVVRTQTVMAYITIAVFALVTICAIAFVPWEQASTAAWNFSWPGMLAQLGASAMLQIGVAPFISDFTRYLPRTTSKAAITVAVFGGTVISALWFSGLGAVIVSVFPLDDPLASIQSLGDQSGFALGTILLAVSVPATLMAVAISFYSAAISLLSGVEAFRPVTTTRGIRAVVITLLGFAVVAAALLLSEDISANFGYFLTFMGYILVPWTAINLIDFYLIRREVYSISDILRPDGGIYRRWSRDGLVSYGLGFVAMVPFFSTPLYTGPAAAALGGADIAFVIGLVVSSGCYLLFNRRFDRAAYNRTVREAHITTID